MMSVILSGLILVVILFVLRPLKRLEKTVRRAEHDVLRLELAEVRWELRLIREPLESAKLKHEEYLERNR